MRSQEFSAHYFDPKLDALKLRIWWLSKIRTQNLEKDQYLKIQNSESEK